jgi:enoyl-CoA hydratase/carnithine racemase
MTELVTVEVVDHVAHVRLNRPEKMNALSIAMMEAVANAAEAVTANRDVRAVVLSGEGKAFCAGIDTTAFTSGEIFGDMFGPGRGGFWPNYYQKPGFAWKQVPVPVIAALHGVAFGGGIQIALGADIRIAHPHTRLSVMEIKWGLIPDMSGSQTLRDLVRLDVAKELVFTGRIVEAPEAERIGLVTRLADDPVAEALALAQRIAGGNPDAVALGKHLLESSWHGDTLAGLRREEKLQASILNTPNHREAIRAGMAKEAPQFLPRAFDDFSALDEL